MSKISRQGLFDRARLNVQVRGFGVCGATAQRFADMPYWEEKKLDDVRVWGAADIHHACGI